MTDDLRKPNGIGMTMPLDSARALCVDAETFQPYYCGTENKPKASA